MRVVIVLILVGFLIGSFLIHYDVKQRVYGYDIFLSSKKDAPCGLACNYRRNFGLWLLRRDAHGALAKTTIIPFKQCPFRTLPGSEQLKKTNA